MGGGGAEMYPKLKDLNRDMKSPLFRCGHEAE